MRDYSMRDYNLGYLSLVLGDLLSIWMKDLLVSFTMLADILKSHQSMMFSSNWSTSRNMGTLHGLPPTHWIIVSMLMGLVCCLNN
ncbi:hypothetical protein RHGRI_012297 [Rhododendron griersonianum]|uniref:Uncharacterized protein n=1 Tax=Rhododendron griersonianum TaxID=479676 RepID=A0AAV6KRD7_9ERIC|nr:hypothetical protein RHGRI_012297 [Rhododendron griersonianum]